MVYRGFRQHFPPHAPQAQVPGCVDHLLIQAAETSRFLRDTQAILANLSRREADL